MSHAAALVLTSIGPPNEVMKSLAVGCERAGWDFVVAGDSKSPADFHIDGCRFLSLDDQRGSGHRLGQVCPERSYTRKNLGYLAAMAGGARVIVETDDDNHPRDDFWLPRSLEAAGREVVADGWVNVFRYFTDAFIYPRGIPLPHARDTPPEPGEMVARDCPVQQGLADNNPDVDAVYRMLFPLPFDFDPAAGPVILGGDAWCPFNSQNTTFFAPALPLLYLPAHCSFRMTDIWRSFVAQRVLKEMGHGIRFHAATVWHERNEHDLHRDFMEEVPGYSNNEKIRIALKDLRFPAGATMRRMLESCYETLIRGGWVGAGEEALLAAWCDDLEALGVTGA